MTNILQHIPTWKLVHELESRHAFSQLVQAVLLPEKLPQPDPGTVTPAADPTKLQVKAPAPTPDKADILRGLMERLDASKDTRTESDIDGDTGDPSSPTSSCRYVVTGAEREVLLEASTEALQARLNDPDNPLPEGERREIRRLMSLRSSSAAPSLGTAGAIAANLKGGAEAAFIQPKLPGVPGQGITHEDIASSRGWVKTPLVRTPIMMHDPKPFEVLASMTAQDPSLCGSTPKTLAISGDVCLVTSEDRLVASRVLLVLAKFLASFPADALAARRIYEALSPSGNLGLPHWDTFAQNPESVCESYREVVLDYVQSSDIPADQRRHHVRFLAPAFTERFVDPKLFEHGQQEGLKDLRDLFEGDLREQGSDPSAGTFQSSRRPPKVTGNHAVDQALASAPGGSK